MKRTEKRDLIEDYMKFYEIDIAAITETHINRNQTEIRKEYTWYFSGGDTAEHHFAGVAIIIANKIKNTVNADQSKSTKTWATIPTRGNNRSHNNLRK